LMADSSPTLNALAGFGSVGGQAGVASRQGSCEPEHSCGQEREGYSEMEEANNNYGGIGPNLHGVDKVDITSLSPRSIGYGDTAEPSATLAAGGVPVVPGFAQRPMCG